MGSGGSPQAQAIQSAPVPLPAPPVTQNNPAVIQAQHDIAQANLLKKSVKKTIFAGDTGGFGAGQYGKQPTGPMAPGGGKFGAVPTNLGPRP